jgi:hypothetical protein
LDTNFSTPVTSALEFLKTIIQYYGHCALHRTILSACLSTWQKCGINTTGDVKLVREDSYLKKM